MVVAADGHATWSAGQTTTAVFPRSANKPMQAAGMLRCGLDLDGKLLALAAASHSGEAFHVAGAQEILTRAGLDAAALQCPPALPLDEAEQAALLRGGGEADRLHMNCSGKHAAMLATCVSAGWPTGSYLDPGHPLQQEIRRTVEAACGEQAAAVAVDGCGAPLLAVSLTGLARALSATVVGEAGSPERRVADAMRAHPEWTSGSTRPERALMEAVPGLLVKSGAEGVMAFALPDGRAAAFKFDDGAGRAGPALAVALLRMLGVEVGGAPARNSGPRPAGLEEIATPPVHGGGRVVGHIRITLPE